MLRLAHCLLIIFGTILILAGALSVAGFSLAGHAIAFLNAVVLMAFGFVMLLAPRITRILIDWSKRQIVVDRDVEAASSSPGFDDTIED